MGVQRFGQYWKVRFWKIEHTPIKAINCIWILYMMLGKERSKILKLILPKNRHFKQVNILLFRHFILWLY